MCKTAQNKVHLLILHMGSVAGNELVKNFHIFFSKEFFKFDCCTAKANYVSCLKREVSDKGVWDSSTVRNRIAIAPRPGRNMGPFLAVYRVLLASRHTVRLRAFDPVDARRAARGLAPRSIPSCVS